MSSQEPSVPQIECTKCGTEHHFDWYGEHCRDCSAFLREPTIEEYQQMGEFMEAQMEE